MEEHNEDMKTKYLSAKTKSFHLTDRMTTGGDMTQ